MRRLRGVEAATTVLIVLTAACSPLFGERTPPPIIESETPTLTAATLAVTQTATLAPQPFALDLTPFPTATPLPTLELPTQAAAAVGMQVWDGLPTYPAESVPGYYFRLEYDPASWALTISQFGHPVLAHRAVPACVLAPSAGRGLPLNAGVEHDIRAIGAVMFQVDTASVGGETKFVSYTGGDGVIYTSFEVQFTEMADLCLPAAEVVLGTLQSVPLLEATPVQGS